MRILLPTGAATEAIVRAAASDYDVDVIVTGEIASFLTPVQLKSLIRRERYDMVIVSGMCTASFHEVEVETGVPIYLGPRHAADLPLILPLLKEVELSRSIPADDFLAFKRREAAVKEVVQREQEADFDFLIRGLKVGGMSRMKVLAEIMDAHKHKDLKAEVEHLLMEGADIIDLGFGFDATPADVHRCFSLLEEIEVPLAIDTLNPRLIEAGLFRADIVLSLNEDNIPQIGYKLAEQGTAAVIIPGRRTLKENIAAAEAVGVTCIIADPLLMPVGTGFVRSIAEFSSYPYPLFFGAGNVVELFDADSIGVNALLAGLAHELSAAIIFSSEHSDKTHGSIAEMRRATEMMFIMKGRPYPKDLGIDLLVLKEKRRRREPPLVHVSTVDALSMPREIMYDPCGNFRIGIEDEEIVAVINGRAVRGHRWADIFYTIMVNGDVSLLDHAAYLGAELFKAELAIKYKRSFEQDGPF